MSAHTKYRPFICAQCDETFKYEGGLNVHVKAHHHRVSESSDSEDVEEIPPPHSKKRKPREEPQTHRKRQRRAEEEHTKHDSQKDVPDAEAGSMFAEMKADIAKQAEEDVTQILVQTYTQVAATKLQRMRELMKKL
ncbi:hypothetical protein EXIGLDRAFT_769061 [Exidia glandulosa HHB12029]|uniref:C2H2-type domain-containing protein n=1 Tax=Exidia glandulosa HHB12029 TaxID=1314781 RepID=A0A165HSN5_EXIGL|nr:hypothetical protein EXIGLDRAFT_769061 [Exidia glandulosa HHB12029]